MPVVCRVHSLLTSLPLLRCLLFMLLLKPLRRAKWAFSSARLYQPHLSSFCNAAFASFTIISWDYFPHLLFFFFPYSSFSGATRTLVIWNAASMPAPMMAFVVARTRIHAFTYSRTYLFFSCFAFSFLIQRVWQHYTGQHFCLL